MKSLIGICFFLCFSSASLSQSKISVVLKDGQKLEGDGRITNDDRILYRVDKDSEKHYYDHKSVDTLTVYDDDLELKYVYKIIDGSGGLFSVKLLEIAKAGPINLYQDVQLTGSVVALPGFGATGGVAPTTTVFHGTSANTNYYLSRSSEDVVINLWKSNTYNSKFRKIAKDYFHDCPDLLEKIASKEYFERYHIRSVVDYYNEECQ